MYRGLCLGCLCSLSPFSFSSDNAPTSLPAHRGDLGVRASSLAFSFSDGPHSDRKPSSGHLPPTAFQCGLLYAAFMPFLCLHADAKPTVETLGPTVRSEETTTPYPIDEEATECGENCSFEDGEGRGQSCMHPGWHGCRPVGMEADLRLGRDLGVAGSEVREERALRGLGQWPFPTNQYWSHLYSPMGMNPLINQLK